MVEDGEEGEFRRMIGLNVSLLKLSGVIAYGRGFASRNGLALVAFACLTIYSISYTYRFLINITDFTVLFESFPLIMSLVGGEARFAILLWFRGSCESMLNSCEFFWSLLKPPEKEMVRSYVNKAKQLTRFYLASCILTILFYGLFALLDCVALDEWNRSAEESDRNGSELEHASHRRLPYAFFLEVEQTPWYEITYVFQLVAMLNVGFVCVGVDTVGPLLVLTACGYFDAIRSRIEGLRSIDREKSSLKLRICVIHHRMLLKFCYNLERRLNLIALVQVASSTYNISLVGFKLIEDTPGRYKYVTQLLISVIQLFLCNWPPDLLLAKSEAIGRAAYSIPWYRYPNCLLKPTSTATMMMTMRGQKPVRLTAGKIVNLSLETFASLISAAASFFSVVRNVN